MPAGRGRAEDDLALVRWAPRVSPAAIRRLYATDALGIVDEEQIAAVGGDLAARCESILLATEAHRGRVTCPRCGAVVRPARDAPDIRCRCGWCVERAAYHRTYQHQQLYGAGAVGHVAAYLEEYERARSPQERMLAIDRLLHAFHGELAAEPRRPAAKNLIDLPTTGTVLAFLDRLAYGEAGTAGLREAKAAWDALLPRAASKRLRRGLGQAGTGC